VAAAVTWPFICMQCRGSVSLKLYLPSLTCLHILHTDSLQELEDFVYTTQEYMYLYSQGRCLSVASIGVQKMKMGPEMLTVVEVGL